MLPQFSLRPHRFGIIVVVFWVKLLSSIALDAQCVMIRLFVLTKVWDIQKVFLEHAINEKYIFDFHSANKLMSWFLVQGIKTIDQRLPQNIPYLYLYTTLRLSLKDQPFMRSSGLMANR